MQSENKMKKIFKKTLAKYTKSDIVRAELMLIN